MPVLLLVSVTIWMPEVPRHAVHGAITSSTRIASSSRDVTQLPAGQAMRWLPAPAGRTDVARFKRRHRCD